MGRKKPKTSTLDQSGLPWTFKGQSWTARDSWALGLSLLSLTLTYLYTMWPSVAGGDSGELTAAAYTWGVVHPPGYPLFTMIGHLFTYLPLGSVAWRVNLVSVVFSLASLGLVFLIVRKLTGQIWAALLSTLTLGFSQLIWRYSIAAEVFSLNNFFVAAMIWGALKYIETKDQRWGYGIAFLFGLGLTNHHTLVFVGLSLFVLFLIMDPPQWLRPKAFFLLIGSGLIGLLPYLYLFFASHQAPLISWGDITSWDGFLTHLLRKEYGTFKLATEGSNQFQLLWGLLYYLQSLAWHHLGIGFLFIGYGIWALWRTSTFTPKMLSRWMVVLPLAYLIFFHTLANLPFVEGAALYRDIVARFWLMPHVFMAIIAGVGFAQASTHPLFTTTWQKILSLGIPLGLLLLNFQNENHRGNYTFRDFGQHMLENLPPNAVLFSLGDINTNSVRYVQTCEGFRNDVKVMDRSLMSYPWFKRIVDKHYPDVILPGFAYHPTQKGAYDFDRLFKANIDRHNIYMNMIKLKNSNEAFEEQYKKNFRLTPYGLTFKVQRLSDPFDVDLYIEESEKFLVSPEKEFPKEPLPDSWDNVIRNNYWLAHHLRAVEILRHALKVQQKEYFERAESLLEDLLRRNSTPPADYFKNAGIAHQHLMKFTSGEERQNHERRMLEVWSLYVKKTDRRDKTYQDIQSVLRAYNRI